MGRRIALNPTGAGTAFLRGVQAAFPGWGGPAEYRWWFAREVGAPAADILLGLEDEQAVAGLAVGYRRWDPGDGAEVLVAIASGAWTAPSARRRGCFTALLEHGAEVAQQRGACALLAFASAARTSLAALDRLAHTSIESWVLQCDGPGDGVSPASPERGSAPGPDELQRWFHAHRPGSGFVYPTAAVFAEQARLARPRAAVVPAADGHWVVLADGAVQAVVHEARALEPAGVAASLTEVAARHGAVRAFTTAPDVAAAAARAGARAVPGRIFAIPAGGCPVTSLGLPSAWLQQLDRA